MKMDPKSPPGPRREIGIALQPFEFDQCLTVPTDAEVVRDHAGRVRRRMSDAQRFLAPRALAEVAARGAIHGDELGDLAPSHAVCERFAHELTMLEQVITRLTSVLDYAVNRRTVVEESAMKMLDDAAAQAEARIERAMLPAESYAELQRYAVAHGDAIRKGRERAKRVRAAQQDVLATAPVNDTHAPAKTGTDPG